MSCGTTCPTLFISRFLDTSLLLLNFSMMTEMESPGASGWTTESEHREASPVEGHDSLSAKPLATPPWIAPNGCLISSRTTGSTVARRGRRQSRTTKRQKSMGIILKQSAENLKRLWCCHRIWINDFIQDKWFNKCRFKCSKTIASVFRAGFLLRLDIITISWIQIVTRRSTVYGHFLWKFI